MKELIEKVYSIIFGEDMSKEAGDDKSVVSYRHKALVVSFTLAISVTIIILILLNILKKIEAL